MKKKIALGASLIAALLVAGGLWYTPRASGRSQAWTEPQSPARPAL